MNARVKKILSTVQRFGLDEWLIRLSKVPLVGEYALAACWDKRGYQSFFDHYQMLKPVLENAGIQVAGKRILEIGSGGSIGVGYFFILDGAAAWLSSDQYQDPTVNRRIRENEARLKAEIAERHPGASAPVPEFRRFDAAELQPDLEGKFDLIFSSAFFEHVRREAVPRILDNMSRYLVPGGYMLHEIDLRDHINVSNPHHFLKYAADEWERLTADSIFYTNRLRASDFKKEFAAHGLKAVFLADERMPLPADLVLADEFASYDAEDLEVTRLTAILKKDV